MMEAKDNGIKASVMDYLRETTIQEECDDFAQSFGSYRKALRQSRDKCQPEVIHRTEVENPEITIQDMALIRTMFIDATFLPVTNVRRINIPFVALSDSRRALRIRVASFEPGQQATALSADINESLRLMLDAVLFLNGDPEHQKIYAHVHELLKASALFIRREIGGEKTAGPAYQIDAVKLQNVLAALPFEASSSLLDYYYGRVYENPKTAPLIKQLGIPREGFRNWIDTFIPTDDARTAFSVKIKQGVEQKVREEVETFKKRLMENLQQTDEKTPVAKIQLVRLELDLADMLEPAEAQVLAAKNEQQTMVHDFELYLKRVQKDGYRFPLPHVKILLDCIFDEKNIWFREEDDEPLACNKIDWKLLEKKGLRKGFEKGSGGDAAFDDFMVQLYHWRNHLKKQGLLTDTVKNEFKKIFNKFLYTNE